MNSKPSLSRRNFAVLLAAAPAASTALEAQQQQPAEPKRQGTVDGILPFKDPLQFTRKDVPAKVQPFPMTQVRLLPSAFLDAAEWNRGYMNRLPADRLLHNFRLNAGLPSSAEPLGGWETTSPRRPAGGATAKANCAATSPVTSSPPARSSTPPRATRKPKPKATTWSPSSPSARRNWGGGYLSAFPTEWFDRLDARKPVWAPFYTIHKIMAGMFDMYQLAGNKQALAGSRRHGRLGRRLDRVEIRRAHAGHPEHRIRRHERSALQPRRRHRQRPLGQSRRPLHQEALLQSAGLCAATNCAACTSTRTFPQVIGAARRYEISGDMRFHDVADFFLVRSHQRAQLRHRRNQQRRRLARAAAPAGRGTEAQRGHRRVLLRLQHAEADAPSLQLDRATRATSITTSARCSIIASAPSSPRPAHTQYYLSLTPGAWKTFNTEDKSFWCCTGTGVEEYSKLNDSIYWHDAGRRLRQPLHPVGAELAGEGLPAAAGHQFPRTANHHLDRHRREARQPRDAPAHSGVDQSRRP